MEMCLELSLYFEENIQKKYDKVLFACMWRVLNLPPPPKKSLNSDASLNNEVFLNVMLITRGNSVKITFI